MTRKENRETTAQAFTNQNVYPSLPTTLGQNMNHINVPL